MIEKYEMFFVDKKPKPKQTICTEEEFDKMFNLNEYEKTKNDPTR